MAAPDRPMAGAFAAFQLIETSAENSNAQHI
jgi:hypothetical protein